MAVEYDNSTENFTSTNSSSDVSYSHTVSGDNPALVVYVGFDDPFSGADLNGVTYNGVSMTEQINEFRNAGSFYFKVFTLLNPTLGSNTVTLDFNTNPRDYHWSVAISYNGVGAIGAISVAEGESSTPSDSITTTQDNSMISVGLTGHGGDTDPFSPANGETERHDGATGTAMGSEDHGFWVAELLKATAGAQTVGATMSVSDDWIIAAVELQEDTSTDPFISDSVTVAESVALGGFSSPSASDTVAVGESVSIFPNPIINTSDNVSLSEQTQVYVVPVYSMSVSENLSIQDTPQTEKLLMTNYSPIATNNDDWTPIANAGNSDWEKLEM